MPKAAKGAILLLNFMRDWPHGSDKNSGNLPRIELSDKTLRTPISKVHTSRALRRAVTNNISVKYPMVRCEWVHNSRVFLMVIEMGFVLFVNKCKYVL